MPVNLLAICRVTNSLIVKRVKITSNVQSLIEGVFRTQEAEFWDGVDDEIPFDGGWKPDKNELLVASPDIGTSAMFNAACGNVMSLEEISPTNFVGQGIKALGVVVGDDADKRLLLQNFTARQVLDRSISLIWDGETFTRLTAPSFTLGTSIAGIVNSTSIKFKSFSNIKMIFDLANLYQEASNQKIQLFASHSSVAIHDVMALQTVADQTIRKLVNAVSAKNVLGTYSVDVILAAAVAQGFDLQVHDSRIVFPQDRASVKRLMHFLDEGLYRGPISGASFITNSKKPA